MDRRPPLPMSPRRLRSRRVPKPDISCKTPPSSGPARSPQVQHHPMAVDVDDDNPQLRPEYQIISSQLQSLARRAQEQFGQPEALSASVSPSRCVGAPSMFERGRMYELYSARRNERLKRRKGEESVAEEKRPWDLGVCSAAVGIKKVAKKSTAESARRSVDSSSAVARRSYSLRSSVRGGREVKEGAAALFATPAKSAVGPAKGVVGTRKCRRK